MRLALRTLGLLLWLAAGAARASWFGAPCPGPALIPVTDHEVFLRMRSHEADAGADETLRVLRDGRIQARPDTLLRLKVSVPDGRSQPDGEGGFWQSLDDVPGLEYRYDSCTQELLLDLRRTRRAANIVLAQGPARLAQPALQPGGFINLDVQAVSGSEPSWGGLGELGAFAGAGHGTLTLLNRAGASLRLDTQWVLDRPASLTQWVIGDAIGREAPGRRPVRFGGLSWGSEYSLQPDIVTFPLPTLRGDAVLPSTVDVYVDGVLRQREDVPPGPFELRSVPVTSGGGQMRAVVRDLLGREQVLAQPFYVTPGLLREGLNDYRLETGWLRRAYGTRSNDYGPAFAAASYRRGLSERYTGALQMDADAQRQALGAGLAAQLGGFGSANFELAGSRADAGAGAQAELGLARSGELLSLSLELRAATARYAALGDTQAPARYALSARAGMPLWSGDSLSATVIVQSNREVNREINPDAGAGASALRLYSLNYGRRLAANWLLGAQLTRSEAIQKDWTFGAGLTWVLGGHSSASAYVQRSGDVQSARAGWQRQPEEALGLGYQLDIDHAPSGASGSTERAIGQLRWTQQRGTLAAAVETSAERSALRYGFQTGLAWLGGAVFSTRPVQGSFAVVDAGGAEGVRIYRDHQLVARTDAHGRALVPDLRAYEANTLNLQLSDLPIEQRADAEEITVVPYARSGMAVSFAVSATIRDRWLRLRLTDGSWLPSGAEVSVRGGVGETLTGTEGRVLLRGVSGAALLEASWNSGRCRTQLRPAAAAPTDFGNEVLLCAAY